MNIIEMFKNKPRYVLYAATYAAAVTLFIAGLFTGSNTCMIISAALGIIYGEAQTLVLEHLNAGNTALSDIIQDQTEQISDLKDKYRQLQYTVDKGIDDMDEYIRIISEKYSLTQEDTKELNRLLYNIDNTNRFNI